VLNVALLQGSVRCAEALNDSCCFIQQSEYQYSASSAMYAGGAHGVKDVFNKKDKYQSKLELESWANSLCLTQKCPPLIGHLVWRKSKPPPLDCDRLGRVFFTMAH
jgi:hypothetical protein